MESGQSSDRPGRKHAIGVARRQFLNEERIDLGAIAGALGINRITLYRWFGGRDQLIAETLWSLSRQTLRQTMERIPGGGLDWVYEVIRDSTTAIAGNPAYRSFLRREPEMAARVLFTGKGALRGRTITAYQYLLESNREDLSPEVEPAAIARAIVRCGEPFLYGDQLGRDDPDPESTFEILRMILGWARHGD